MKKPLLLLTFLILWSGTGHSQIVSESAEERHLTVYSQQFSGIYDVRTINLEAGRNEVMLLNIPEVYAIDRISVFFDGELKNVRYPVSRPGFSSLLSRLDGKTARLRQGDEQHSGILSWHQGILSVQGEQSQALLNNPENYFIYPDEEIHLMGETALLITLDAERSGPQKVGILYGTSQLGWYARHSIRLHPENKTLDWITEAHLQSLADHDFEDVSLSLLSGDIDIRRLPGIGERTARQPDLARSGFVDMDAYLEMDEAITREELSDFFVYRLPGTTTVESRTRRSFTIHENRELPYHSEYVYVIQGRHTDSAQPAAFAVFNEDDDARIGETLPAGNAFLNSFTSGSPPEFQANLDFTITNPGDRLELPIREEVPVAVTESYRHEGDRQTDRYSHHTIRLDHTGTEAITLNVRNYISSHHRVYESSIPFERIGGYVQGTVELQPGETKEVRLTIQIPHQQN